MHNQIVRERQAMNKRLILGAIIAVALGCVWPACADDGSVIQPTAAAAVATRTWERAQAVLDATDAEVANGGGFSAVQAHLPDLEQALADADKAFAEAGAGTDVTYVLTDGPTDTLFSLTAAAAASDKNSGASGKKTVAVNNPYPQISLYIGANYNEIGKFDEALRALDRGLALYSTHGIVFGAHQPSLVSERAVALARLGRLPEALAAYEDGLKLAAIDDKGRARMHRGRGFVLTEMGRLDEAEAAYRESLKFEPDNKIAKGELDYIARLRAGEEKQPGGITAPGMQPKTQ
jgi:tetratricopeptide (TPR) repeat protein